MKTSSQNSEWGYHTWRDIGGFFGLMLDAAFCVFVIISSFFMVLLGGLLIAFGYVASPCLDMLSRWKKVPAG